MCNIRNAIERCQRLKVAKHTHTHTYIYKTYGSCKGFLILKFLFAHVLYIPSLPSSGDCPTLYVEADFSMDGSDLLASKLTSESCHCDLKGFYILYSHVFL